MQICSASDHSVFMNKKKDHWSQCPNLADTLRSAVNASVVYLWQLLR